MLHQHTLTAVVPGPHGLDLGNGHVRLVDEQKIVFGEIVHQGIGFGPRLEAGQMAGIVFDSTTVAHLLQHFHVVERACLQTLRLEQLGLAPQSQQTLLQLLANGGHRALHTIRLHDVVLSRVDEHLRLARQDLTRDGIDVRDLFDLVAEKLDANRERFIGGIEFDHVPTHTKGPPLKVDVIARVLNVGKAPQQRVAFAFVSHANSHHGGLIVLG